MKLDFLVANLVTAEPIRSVYEVAREKKKRASAIHKNREYMRAASKRHYEKHKTKIREQQRQAYHARKLIEEPKK